MTGASLRTSRSELERASAEYDAQYNAAFVECMAEKGYRVTLPSMSRDAETQLLSNSARPVDEEVARERGLNVVATWNVLTEAENDSAISVEPTDYPMSSMAAGDDCLAQAGEGVGESRFKDLLDSYRSEVMQTETVSAARKSWSHCMSSRGFPATNLEEVVALVNTSDAASKRASLSGAARTRFEKEIFEREVEAASAVADCDRQAYFPVFHDWASLERNWMDEHSASLSRLPDRFRLFWAAFIGI